MAGRTHTCVYFDDGEPEMLCVCGGRALLLLDGETEIFLAVDAGAVRPRDELTVALTTARPHADALSA